MENQFLPYELAVKLKELGFDEPCFAYYETDGKLTKSELSSIYFAKYIVKGTNACIAPLWQQAFDWFRNRKDFESFIKFTQGYGNRSHSYHIFDTFRVSDRSIYLGEGTTHEEARQSCLEKLIELAQGD